MRRKKLINKKAFKHHYGKCFFCDIEDYALLEVHRIVPGEEGGEYSWSNSLVCCSNCHKRVHDGQIKIDRKYPAMSGKDVLHYWENTEEKWVSLGSKIANANP